MKKKTKVTCIQCPNCKDTLYSRARHDWNICTCGDTFIDGGFEYVRIGAKDINKVKTFHKFVNATKKELYDDWNNNSYKFGKIK